MVVVVVGGGDLCGNLLFICISPSKTIQVTCAFDFNAWKYKPAVKKVSLPLCLLRFEHTLLALSNRIGVTWQADKPWKQEAVSVNQGAEEKLVQCNGLNDYTGRLKVKNNFFVPAQNSNIQKPEILQAWW